MRLDRGLVAEASRPRRRAYTLTPRNPERQIHLGGDTINFTLVAGPPNVHDMERGRRAGNYQDYSRPHPAGAAFQLHPHARQPGLRADRAAGELARISTPISPT